ncbi:MAG: hypothetical protein OXG54_02525, partial [Gammaproteobacteria bacterium]|nr:hypothetical protein [Gammaproteobacteria bacterium]
DFQGFNVKQSCHMIIYPQMAQIIADFFPLRHSLHPSLDATLRAAIAVQIGRPADLSRAGGNPVK